ncbi:hypothetical protein Tco_0478920 [Tanacetum coccineum]
MTTVRQQFNLRTSMSNDVIERKPYQASAPQCQTEVHHAAETVSYKFPNGKNDDSSEEEPEEEGSTATEGVGA